MLFAFVMDPEVERRVASGIIIFYRDRIVTLRRAAELYKKEPDNFLAIEIYV